MLPFATRYPSSHGLEAARRPRSVRAACFSLVAATALSAGALFPQHVSTATAVKEAPDAVSAAASLPHGRALLRALAGGALLAALAVAVRTLIRRPSLDRTWDEDVGVITPVVNRPDGSIVFSRVRQWTYTRGAVTSKHYFEGVYDPDDVISLWLYEQVLGLGGRIAHTFLVFEFPEAYGGGRWLGLSVEARREVGETYALLGGMLRAFEMAHVWAVEDDLVRRRVEYLDYPLTRYRVTIPADQVASLFRQFAAETKELAAVPQWYNTLTKNCTSVLIRYVNTANPGAIPWHYSFVLTGVSDSYLTRLGYVDAASAEPITRASLAVAPLR